MVFDGHRTQVFKRAVRMADVPPEKWSRIFLRSLVGGIIGLAGLGTLVGVVWVYIKTQAMSIPLLTVGVAAFGIGAHMVSGQMFSGSVKAVVGLASSVTVKRLRRASKDEAGEEPTDG